MTIRLCLLLSAATVLLSGCAANQSMYRWEDYSDTLYRWTKDATAERAAEHVAELAMIIKKSEAKGVRVPPGIHCEYGYMLMLAGDHEEAMRCFRKEAEVYPESGFFVNFLLKRCEESDSEEVQDDAQNN